MEPHIRAWPATLQKGAMYYTMYINMHIAPVPSSLDSFICSISILIALLQPQGEHEPPKQAKEHATSNIP